MNKLVDKASKLFNVGQFGARSLKTVLKEAAKCMVVCANCHMTRTYNTLKYKYYKGIK